MTRSETTHQAANLETPASNHQWPPAKPTARLNRAVVMDAMQLWRDAVSGDFMSLVDRSRDVAMQMWKGAPFELKWDAGWIEIRVQEFAVLYMIMAVVVITVLNRITQVAVDAVIQHGLASLVLWWRGRPVEEEVDEAVSFDVGEFDVAEAADDDPDLDEISRMPKIRFQLRGNVFHCFTICQFSSENMEERRMCKRCWDLARAAGRTMYGGNQ